MRTQKAQSQLEIIQERQALMYIPEPPKRIPWSEQIIILLTLSILIGIPVTLAINYYTEQGYFGPYVEKVWNRHTNVHYRGKTYSIKDLTSDYKTHLPVVIDQTIKDLKADKPVSDYQEHITFNFYPNGLQHYSTDLESVDVINLDTAASVYDHPKFNLHKYLP